jgi:hypothetical protein
MNVTVYIHMTFQHVKSGPNILRIFLHGKERLAARVTLIGGYYGSSLVFVDIHHMRFY